MLINLPKKSKQEEVRGNETDDSYEIFVRDSGFGAVSITTIYKSPVGDLGATMAARDIASAIENARDIGYRQAMSDVRNLIGIT